jgi:hypothetical protein
MDEITLDAPSEARYRVLSSLLTCGQEDIEPIGLASANLLVNDIKEWSESCAIGFDDRGEQLYLFLTSASTRTATMTRQGTSHLFVLRPCMLCHNESGAAKRKEGLMCSLDEGYNAWRS